MNIFKFRLTTYSEYSYLQQILPMNKYYWCRLFRNNKIIWSSFDENSLYLVDQTTLDDGYQEHSLYSELGIKLENEFLIYLRMNKINKLYNNR